MCRVILLLLLGVAGNSAVAGWVEIGHNKDFSGYIDPATTRRAGNMVKMWCLIDHKTAITKAGKTYSSVKAQHEYDCKEGRVRMLFSSAHSGSMGQGEIMGSNYSSDDWDSVPPRSIVETLWEVACGDK